MTAFNEEIVLLLILCISTSSGATSPGANPRLLNSAEATIVPRGQQNKQEFVVFCSSQPL